MLLMTVIAHDARSGMIDQGFVFESSLPTEVLYADDTLLIHSAPQLLQAYMRSIEVCGRTYGLSLNFDKVEALPVKCLQTIQNSDGSAVKTKECLKYSAVQ